MSKQTKQLGELLLETGKLTEEQLNEALDEQRRVGRSLGRVLVELGMLTEQQLVATLAEQVGMRFVDLSEYPVDPLATSRLPEAMARRYSALPIGYDNGRLLVAMSDPGNVFAVDDIRAVTGMELRTVVATKSDIAAA